MPGRLGMPEIWPGVHYLLHAGRAFEHLAQSIAIVGCNLTSLSRLLIRRTINDVGDRMGCGGVWVVHAWWLIDPVPRPGHSHRRYRDAPAPADTG